MSNQPLTTWSRTIKSWFLEVYVPKREPIKKIIAGTGKSHVTEREGDKAPLQRGHLQGREVTSARESVAEQR